MLGRKRQGDALAKAKVRLAVEANRLPELLSHLKQKFRYVEIDGTLPELQINQSIRKEVSQCQ